MSPYCLVTQSPASYCSARNEPSDNARAERLCSIPGRGFDPTFTALVVPIVVDTRKCYTQPLFVNGRRLEARCSAPMEVASS